MTSTTKCGSRNIGRDMSPARETAKECKGVVEASDGGGPRSVPSHEAQGCGRVRAIRPRRPGGCDPGGREDGACGEADHEGAVPKARRDGTAQEPDAGGVRVVKAVVLLDFRAVAD